MKDVTKGQGRLFVVFAGPRSGSNMLVEKLSKTRGAITLWELFNASGPVGLNRTPELEARIHQDVGSGGDLTRALRLDPAGTMARLLDLVPDPAPVFVKLLHNQVHRGALREILARHGGGAIFLTRARLDQYISLRKVLLSKSWSIVDTTEIRAEIQTDGFLSWTAVMDDWLRESYALCRELDIPTVHLTYDTDLNLTSPKQVDAQIVSKMAPLGLDVERDALADATFYKRQDLAADPFEKIANGEALRTELTDLGYLGEACSALDLEAEERMKERVPDVIAHPDAGWDMLRRGDYSGMRTALHRIGRDVAPGGFHPPCLERRPHGFRRVTFVCGLHRSGTSMLHDQIAARFDVATLRNDAVPHNEGHFLQQQWPQEHPFGGPGYFAFAPQMNPPPERDRRRAAAIAEDILQCWAAHANDPEHPHLLEKSPSNLTRIAWMRSVFSGARFVVIVRDPRAVVLATRRWRPTAPEVLLAHWHTAHLSALMQMEDDCLLVRYEDFCSDPAGHLDDIGAFCDLPLRDPPQDAPDDAQVTGDRNARYVSEWPDDVYFAPEIRTWELFGYRF